MTTVSKRKTRKRKLQAADCEQSELNSKWIKEIKSERGRMYNSTEKPRNSVGKVPKTW